MTQDIAELAQWLAAHGVTNLAMESTGVYWKPIWNLLEDQFELTLVNAQHIKMVPGRRTLKTTNGSQSYFSTAC